MRASRLFCWSPVVFAMLASVAARAADDGLHLNAGIGWHHDNNLLRVPDNDPGYGGQRSDSWRQADAGVAFDHLYGRQRLAASAQISQVEFDQFSQLDYDGKDARATWYWQAGNQFEGRLGASHIDVLAPYTDLRTSERNLRVQRSAFFDGAWRLHPRWRVQAALRDDRFRYELFSQRPNNRRERAVETGIDYVARSGSEAGLVLRRLEGRYPFRRPFALATDDFHQDEVRLRINWLASAKTTVNLLAGRTSRSQDAFGPDRVSGLTGRLSMRYAASAGTSIDTAVWRDFAPIESTVVSYTLNRGASIAAAWQATAKLQASASASFEQRAYNPRNTLPAALRNVDLDDSLRSAALTLRYVPARNMQLGVTVASQVRSGARALGIGAFRSTSAGINASLTF